MSQYFGAVTRLWFVLHGMIYGKRKTQDLFCATWYEIHEGKTKVIQVQENPNFRRNYQQDLFCAMWNDINDAKT